MAGHDLFPDVRDVQILLFVIVFALIIYLGYRLIFRKPYLSRRFHSSFPNAIAKILDTPILKGYQLYHNYLRPHEGLNGRTPADACGIKIEGENKWITIIQNARRASTVDSKGDAP